MTTALAPIVTIINGSAFTNSRDVGAFFEKEHHNILKDIDTLLGLGVVGFHETPYIHPQNGQTYRYFEMTKDAFTMLAMGYTGSKAIRFKIAYIAAFNEMEARLKTVAPALPDFSNPVLAARAWADEVEQKQALQIENQKLVPLATIGEMAASHDHTIERFIRTLDGDCRGQKLDGFDQKRLPLTVGSSPVVT